MFILTLFPDLNTDDPDEYTEEGHYDQDYNPYPNKVVRRFPSAIRHLAYVSPGNAARYRRQSPTASIVKQSVPCDPLAAQTV